MGRLLFITPVLPGPTGQGTAIRAGIALEILAEKFDVTVVHVDLWSGDPAIADREWTRKIAEAYHLVPTPVAPDAAETLVARHLSQVKFDAVYVYRLVAAPLALRVISLLGQHPLPNVLDLDDDECSRTEKFQALRDAAGDRERAELHRLRGFARLMVSRFDKGLLASNEDLESIARQYPNQSFALLPNVMRIPGERPRPNAGDAGSLLFLGTLDYLPNEDGVLYFANSILPLLMESCGRVEFRIAGIKPPKSMEKLRDRAGITLVGPVRDVSVEYGRARIAVVPLRAGSGTRIKILEAFRYGVPVVSTSIGAAGLDLRHEVHLLIADTPEEFRAACLRLMQHDQLADALAQNAFDWLRATLSLDVARGVLHSLFELPKDGSLQHSLP